VKPRTIVFYTSSLASLTAIVMVPFFEHWYSVMEAKEAWSAVVSPELHVWLRFGGFASLIAFVGSFLAVGGKGSSRSSCH
jgi:hypothetical protein